MPFLETGKPIPNYSEETGLAVIKYVRLSNRICLGTYGSTHSEHALLNDVFYFDPDSDSKKPQVDDAGNINLPNENRECYEISNYVADSVRVKSLENLGGEEYDKEFERIRMETAQIVADATGISVRVKLKKDNYVTICSRQSIL